MAHDSDSIGFRRLEMPDLAMVWRWRNTGCVKQWYSKREVSYQEVVETYTPRIAGTAPTQCYIVVYGNRPIGFIQTYRLRDYPEYAAALEVEEGAAGVDMFIGEPDYIHKGLGSCILRRFLHEVVFGLAGVTCCVMGPEPKNTAATRAYEKAGLRYLKTVQVQGEGEPECLMRIGREEVLGT